jgi:hypothetical protein
MEYFDLCSAVELKTMFWLRFEYNVGSGSGYSSRDCSTRFSNLCRIVARDVWHLKGL